jgi:hypothetical protein
VFKDFVQTKIKIMKREEQYTEHTKEENWTEEQEKGYWHNINKRHDAGHVLDYVRGLSTMEIVDLIASAKGYKGDDIFKDCARPALEYEIATDSFLHGINKIATADLLRKTTAKDQQKGQQG